MINPDELVVCKRRGHNAGPLGTGWSQCKWCGMWVREVCKIEEREDDPPETERSPQTVSKALLREMGEKVKGK